MTPIKLKASKDRAEWLEQRRKGIGGSDAGAVLGLNPYKSRFSLWADKSGLIDDEVEDNERMRLGRDLEDYVAKRFCEQEGKKVRRCGYIFQNPDHPFMLANVDRLIVGEPAGLECKTASPFRKADFEDGKIPPEYYAQCMHYMAVTGLKRWYIAVLILQEGLYVLRVDYDPEWAGLMIKEEESFWKMVEDGIRPEADGSEATSEALKKMYPYGAEGQPVKLEPEIMTGWDELDEREKELNQQLKEIAEEKEKIKNRIKSEMEDSTEADIKGYKITWKNNKPSFDRTKFQKENPDAYKSYCTKAGARVMRISKKKEKK